MPLSMAEHVRHTLPVWIDEASRVLVLGTIPSPKSREKNMYYGHAQNRFWRTLASLWGEKVPQGPDEARAFALRHHLALWDVLAECAIEGARDSSIREERLNDVAALLVRYPNITHIVTTGTKARDLYKRYLLPQTNREAMALPSTSAANRSHWPDDKLVNAYQILLDLTEDTP